MTASKAMPSRVTSRELMEDTPAFPVFGAERRRISVGIFSLYGCLGKRFGSDGPDPRSGVCVWIHAGKVSVRRNNA